MRNRERAVYALLIFIGVITVFFALVGSDGVPEVRRLQGDIEVIREEIVELERRQKELSNEIMLLRDDPYTIERRAREDLKMLRSDETVILLNMKAGDAD
jgi:cell division protein FtsB